jgi:hypothetical protein
MTLQRCQVYGLLGNLTGSSQAFRRATITVDGAIPCGHLILLPIDLHLVSASMDSNLHPLSYLHRRSLLAFCRHWTHQISVRLAHCPHL